MTLPPGASGAPARRRRRHQRGVPASRSRTGARRSSRRARRRSPASTRPRRPGCAGSPSRGAAHARACSRSDEDYLALEWIEPGALSADGAEELGRGSRGTQPGGRRASARAGRAARRRASARCACPTSRRRTGRASTPSAACCRWRGSPASAARSRRDGAPRRRSACASGSRSCAAAEPPSRLHGDLWGGNVMAGADGRAWLIDPSALRRAPRGRPGDAARCSARRRRASSSLRGGAHRSRAGAAERVELYQLAPLLVHASLFGGSYVGSVARSARRVAAPERRSRLSAVGVEGRSRRCALRGTIATRRRLYLLGRVVVARHYRRELTLTRGGGGAVVLDRANCSAPMRSLGSSFSEDLHGAADGGCGRLLPARAARDPGRASVARLVGYRQPCYFARAFRRRFGVSPVRFRAARRRPRGQRRRWRAHREVARGELRLGAGQTQAHQRAAAGRGLGARSRRPAERRPGARSRGRGPSLACRATSAPR